jgi:putative nucleotidyltransferase with HDIG domain
MSSDLSESVIRVLCVDDEPNILNALRRMLVLAGFEIEIAESGEKALEVLTQQVFDVVVCDMQMPQMNGAQLLEIIKEKYPETVRILLTGHADLNAAVDAVNRGGIFRFLTKPWDDAELVNTLRSATELTRVKKERDQLTLQVEAQNNELKELVETLEQKVQWRTQDLSNANEQLKKAYVASIKSLSGMLGLRNRALLDHSRNVANLSFKVAHACGMDDAACQEVFIGGLLHDIGKIGLGDRVLRTAFHELYLTDLPAVKNHPLAGAQLLQGQEDMTEVAAIIAGHHEQVDGNGYPRGTMGQDLSLGTRIVAVVEAYFELIEGETRAQPYSAREALQYIVNEQDRRFSSVVVPHFSTVLQKEWAEAKS